MRELLRHCVNATCSVLTATGLSACFFLFAHSATAQHFPNLRFDHLSVKDGLSNDIVSSITQDRQGFIWIGTSNGLNRYDGYRFKQYYHSNTDSNSLVNNTIQTLYCDKKSRIWIGTEYGVSCFIPAENRFVNFSSGMASPHYLKNGSSVGVYEDAEGIIWLSNQQEVIYRVLPDITLEEIKINIPPNPLQGYQNICRDLQGNEWAFKSNTIYKINKKTRQPDKIFDFSLVLNDLILKILPDSTGNFVVGTWSRGLWQFNPGKSLLRQITTLPSRIFADIEYWNLQKKRWIVCVDANRGLYLVDDKTLSAKIYGFIPGNPFSMQGNNFYHTLVDNKGNLWLGSNRGINKIKSEADIFDIIPVTDPGTPDYDLPKSGPVFSFLETDSSIWLGKRYVSTFEYDTVFTLKSFYASLSPPSSTRYSASGYAYYFYKKQPGLYITTDSGLIMYDLQKRSVSGAYYPPGHQGYSAFRTIIPLNDSEILIRSFDKGLFTFNTTTRQFTKHFAPGNICKECMQLKVNYLFKTKQNEIYITTSGAGNGLLKYQPQTDNFVPVKALNDEKHLFQSSDLFGMDEDREGNLWITGTWGLFIYNQKTNIISQPVTDKRIGRLFRICFDNAGNAWTNGTSGIWCYLRSRKKWVNFDGQDGLPGSDFEGIITVKKNGDIIAGLEGAVAIFHPGKLTERLNGCPVVITEASVANNLLPFPLNNGAGKKLTISPGQNSFSVDFAILNYLSPASSHYYYKLEPLMKDFQLNDNGHINFNGLFPGHYTLYVKAGDKAGNFFDNQDVLEISVQPYWYQTNWFKALCVLVLAGITFLVVRKRITTIRKDAGLKQKIAEIEMQALRAQMNPHFIFNCLNSIENFMMQNEKRMASDYLNKFSRLIRSILDSSRNELVPFSKDMEALDLYVELEQLRFNNKFSYKTFVDPALINGDYHVPSLLIQPYIENAIVHGLAHSERKDLELTIAVTLENHAIKYVVLDNGVGREMGWKYKTQNKPNHKSIGLKITAERIALLNRKNTPGAIVITDLYDENKNAAGTKVEIMIKAI